MYVTQMVVLRFGIHLVAAAAIFSGSCCSSAAAVTTLHPRPDTTPEVVYTGPSETCTSRNLSAVLAQSVSVLDFGATADCLCKRPQAVLANALSPIRRQPGMSHGKSRPHFSECFLRLCLLRLLCSLNA